MNEITKIINTTYVLTYKLKNNKQFIGTLRKEFSDVNELLSFVRSNEIEVDISEYEKEETITVNKHEFLKLKGLSTALLNEFIS